LSAAAAPDERGASIDRRVRTAIANARATRRRSELLRVETRLRREDALMTRCAWCGRWAIDGKYVDAADDAPVFSVPSPDRITHGICPPCLGELRADGLTR
jgi:hypothetical protein